LYNGLQLWQRTKKIQLTKTLAEQLPRQTANWTMPDKGIQPHEPEHNLSNPLPIKDANRKSLMLPKIRLAEIKTVAKVT
jgi:hypothetical protein